MRLDELISEAERSGHGRRGQQDRKGGKTQGRNKCFHGHTYQQEKPDGISILSNFSNCRASGTALAVNPASCFNEVSCMLRAGSFAGLDPAEREVLSDWHKNIADRRIDMIIDMSLRAWNTAGARVIIGVFEQGKDAASWLVVECQGSWTVVHCADGTASAEFSTLAEVLALIVV